MWRIKLQIAGCYQKLSDDDKTEDSGSKKINNVDTTLGRRELEMFSVKLKRQRCLGAPSVGLPFDKLVNLLSGKLIRSRIQAQYLDPHPTCRLRYVYVTTRFNQSCGSGLIRSGLIESGYESGSSILSESESRVLMNKNRI
jgi:hypothetical protein